jgi:hypothetical protein
VDVVREHTLVVFVTLVAAASAGLIATAGGVEVLTKVVLIVVSESMDPVTVA